MKESNICGLGQEGSSPINVTQLTSYRSLRHSARVVGYFVSVLSKLRRAVLNMEMREVRTAI